ncbi:anthrax toxin-like adenylyl cyclase domain-containing protein [Providencia rettgeri]|uniref:anthrax toxin-like adenylyl cyclase domain-containing protein n=1 Tax=Providencia rettgeri TaxID=587 RepID=UPI0034E0A402
MNYMEIKFNQNDFIEYIKLPENTAFFSKLMTEYGWDYSNTVVGNGDEAGGLCYGFSNAFLKYDSLGQGKDYINKLYNLLYIINKDIEDLSPIERIRYDALKIHARSLLNEYMLEVIRIQMITERSYVLYKYKDNFYYPKVNENTKLINYLENAVELNNVSTEMHVNHTDYIQSIIEKQKIVLNEYISALIADEQFFLTEEGKRINSDPLLKKLKSELSSRANNINDKFNTEDARIVMHYVYQNLRREEYLKLESYYKLNSLTIGNLDHNYTHYERGMEFTLSIKQFNKLLSKITQSEKQSAYFLFGSEYHQMAVSAIYEPTTNQWWYRFFDSNHKLYQVNDKVRFFKFLNEYGKKQEFIKNKRGGYDVSLLFVYNDKQINHDNYNEIKWLNNNDVKITENVLLSERKIAYTNNNIEVVHEEFNTINNIAKIKLTIENNEKYIYTDILDYLSLYDLIEDNQRILGDIKDNIFISDGNDKIYPVNEEIIRTLDLTNFKKSVEDKDYKSINLHIKALAKNTVTPAIGISESHQHAITKVAEKYNVVIGIRPVDPKSMSLINSGIYSSKGLNIKGKSSDWGPHSGFIPIHQQFAKKSARDEFEKYNRYIQQSIDQTQAIAVQLEITQERVDELMSYKTITPLEALGETQYSATIATYDGKEKIFLLKKTHRNENIIWQVFHLDEGDEIVPFEILGDKKTNKGMTADYDIFSIIFPISELEHYVKVSEMPSWEDWKQTVIYEELNAEQKKLYNSEIEYNKQEGKENGIINKRIKEIKKEINRQLGCVAGYELIHHGADDANPASVMKDNFPITFFLPEKLKAKGALYGVEHPINTYFPMNSDGAIVIDNIKQLSDFQQLLINQDYRVPFNQNWNTGEGSEYFNPKRKISDSYIKNAEEIKRKISSSENESNTNYKSTKELKNDYLIKELGQPIAQLDSDLGDIYHVHKNTQGGEHSRNTSIIDQWGNAIEKYNNLYKQKTKNPSETLPSEYDYNVIIQIEGDETTSGTVARVFSKHPEKSMVIQYNLQDWQYKILHGDLNKIHSGKVRWIIVGHGDYYGNNLQTVFSKEKAAKFVDSICYLREKILRSQSPDKIVLFGCELSRGGINENFTYLAVNEFAKNKMYMPVSSYKYLVGANIGGNKFVTVDRKNRFVSQEKNLKNIYQYDLKTSTIKINNNPSILYFIDELSKENLTIEQLIAKNTPDPFSVFKHPETKQLDIGLIKKIAYNPAVYKQFTEELRYFNNILPDDFYSVFTKKINDQGFIEVPIWKMIDSKTIQGQSGLSRVNDEKSFTVVIRMVGNENGKNIAERLVATSPKNTIVLQMDVDAKTWRIEYGKTEVPSVLPSEKSVNWVVIGDEQLAKRPANDLVAGFIAVKKQYPYLKPENIRYHSTSAESASTNHELMRFNQNLANSLKDHGIEAKLTTTYTSSANIYHVKNLITLESHSTMGNSDHAKIRTLLEKLALKNILISDINEVEHNYLLRYFTDKTGNIDSKKLNSAIYDPLLSRKINKYLMGGNLEDINQWNTLFELKIPSSIQQQSADLLTILQGIHHNPDILNHLSDSSINQLKAAFPSINDFDRGKVLALVSDPNAYILKCDQLMAISQLNDDNFIGENAPYKGLALNDVLQHYQSNYQYRQQQFNQLLNQAQNRTLDSQVTLFNHGIIRQQGKHNDIDNKIGLIYGFETQLGNAESARKLIERKVELEKIQLQGKLSEQQNDLLNKISKYIAGAETALQRKGIHIADQSILDTLSASNIDYHHQRHSVLLIKGKLATFTISHTYHEGIYQYSLLDPIGIQLSVTNKNEQLAKHEFHLLVKNYLTEEITNIDGEQIIRAKQAGFDIDNFGRIRGDIQWINFDDQEIRDIALEQKTQRAKIINHPVYGDEKNSWVVLHGEKIPFFKLQNLGAEIDGKPLAISDTTKFNWHKKIRFHSEKLAAELAMLEGNDSDLALLKIIRQQLNDPEITTIGYDNANFKESGVLRKQLKYLSQDMDIDSPEIKAKLINKLHKVGLKLPRFQRIGNRFGQGMGGAGITQTVISIYAILKKLDDPDLTEAEYAELEKQYYLACGTAFFNYGDMVLQPILLNFASKAGASSLACSRLAAGTVIVFNLVGMGLDAYQAYDNLAKLEHVSDPKQRQDLIVNASFSIASFVVNGVTVIGVLAASSTIPVLGLVVGGLLIVGGWVYNGRRAVENIKAEIDISWSRELEEGIRGAVGLEPTLRSQQEMTIKRYIDAFKNDAWASDLAHYEQTLAKSGFDHHLSIIEKPIYQKKQYYYLVDNKNNYFGGTLGKISYGPGSYKEVYSKKGAPYFTEDDADFLLNNYIMLLDGRVGKPSRRNNGGTFVNEFSKEAKELFDLQQTGKEPSHERYNFNPEYSDSLFTEFKSRHHINESDFKLSVEEQLAFSIPEQLSFFSLKTRFGVFGQTLHGSYQRFSEHIINDRKRISWYLNTNDSTGSSFNTASGNDVIIGHQNKMNAFLILSGEKYFAGGKKSDYFYLRDNSIDSLKPYGIGKITKFLDGLSGQDTLIIDSMPDKYYADIELAKNNVSYKNNQSGGFINVAYIKNIENIVLRNKTNDRVLGDEKDNILDGGSGDDWLYGDSGNDKLILVQGYAKGGKGNDSYQIRRYVWHHQVDNLYLHVKKYNQTNKKVEIKKVINKFYKNTSLVYQPKVIIDEDSQSTSMVNLEYTLREIEDVYIEGNDLFLQIKLNEEIIDGISFSNVSSKPIIKLNNFYRNTDSGRELNHNYILKTHDGFILSSKLTSLDKDTPSIFRDKIFSISYIETLDQSVRENDKSVYIESASNAIVIDGNRVYVSPSWGEFKWTGLAENLTYEGTRGNDIITEVSSGNHIKISTGKDIYRIEQVKDDPTAIIFDFSTVRGLYTDEDKVILLLPTLNGFDLQQDNQTLFIKDRFYNKRFAIRFENYDESMSQSVVIQDKDSNVFSVNLIRDECTLSLVNRPNESTDKNDTIILPDGYYVENNLINSKSGNDLILDKSRDSRILIGGEGDDTIKTFHGNNVLYGGEGKNHLSGGNGNDVLLSSKGIDTLMGGAGDDHYIVDGRHSGMAYIDDWEGTNTVDLFHFKGKPIIEEQADGTVFSYYISEAGKIVKIKQSSEKMGIAPMIHLYDEFPVNLQTTTQNGMGALTDELARKLSHAQKQGLKDIWQPVDEISSELRGALPTSTILTTEKVDKIIIGSNHSRTHWLIDGKNGDDLIIDNSHHGRIIKGGKGNDHIILAVTLGDSEVDNVVYSGEGDDRIFGGYARDVMISLDGNDLLMGGQGNDYYLVNGYGKGHVTIDDSYGRNRAVLVNFQRSWIKDSVNAEGIRETVYQSDAGRTVTIRYDTKLSSMANVIDMQFEQSDKATWNAQQEQTVDRLIQSLVEQRVDDELSMINSPNTHKTVWNPVMHVEQFLTNTL